MTAAPTPTGGAGYQSRVTARRWLTPDTFLLDLERPPGFDFTPGQRIQLQAEGTDRDYSLIPGDHPNVLMLLIRSVPAGHLSLYLGQCPVGTPVHFRGPGGYFVYRSTSRPAVFVATGTGIAPFVAMGREGVRGFALLHGVRRADDLYFRELFATAARPYVPCLSGGTAESLPGAFGGRVTAYLRDRWPEGTYDFYLAGRRDMIAEVIGIVDDRFPSSRIYTEIFY